MSFGLTAHVGLVRRQATAIWQFVHSTYGRAMKPSGIQCLDIDTKQTQRQKRTNHGI